MILLQAAIAGGFIMMTILFICLVVGVPVVTMIIRAVDRKMNSKQAHDDRTGKEKDKGNAPNMSLGGSISVATAIVIMLFMLAVFLFDKCNPDYAYGN
jgi:heme/copper-type cytochrome/quinol oxidase subunit 2